MHPFRHFATITRHRHRVIAHCFRVGIGWQGLLHDLSKYSPAEFWAGARYYQGTRSPNEQERAENGYSLAWMHHKGRNRHHYEYWTDYSLETKQLEPMKMPIRYVAEMFCDRLAASKVYRGDEFDPGDPYKFFLRGKGRQLLLHPATSELLEEILITLRDKGEDAAFDFVRHTFLNKK